MLKSATQTKPRPQGGFFQVGTTRPKGFVEWGGEGGGGRGEPVESYRNICPVFWGIYVQEESEWVEKKKVKSGTGSKRICEKAGKKASVFRSSRLG